MLKFKEYVEVLMDKLKISHQWPLAEKKLTILDCMRSAASRLKEAFFLLYLAIGGHTYSFASNSGLKSASEMGLLERV